MGMRLIRQLAGQRPTKPTISRGSERKVPHIGTETRSKLLREGGSSEEYWSMGESLNQPSSVQDDGPMGCKLLLYGDKVSHVWLIAGTVRIRTG